jgi:putative flippase GtrA
MRDIISGLFVPGFSTVQRVRPSGLSNWLVGFRVSSATHHQAMRFVITGVVVAVVNLGIGLLMSGPLGVPIQVAIPTGYVLSLLLNYTLQRNFVFADRDSFTLSGASQFSRYVQIGAVQYAFTALATAVLPDLLGVDAEVVYVVTAITAAAITFVVIRLAVFHGDQDLPA